MRPSARPKRVKVQSKRAVSSTAGKPPQAKVQAKRLAAKKTPKGDGSEVRELEKRLAQALKQRAEAMKQQAATSEILRVISASPTDVRPVLNAVAERATLLCKAPFARVLLAYGDRLRVAAEHSVDGTVQARTTDVPLSGTSITGRAILDRAIIHHADILPLLDTEFPDTRENARRVGFRAVLAVPLMREGGALGAIFLWRREPGLFAPQHVALVETFARQAAIAIDHARLFNETKEALARQIATADILRAISSSPTDVQPVFDTIVATAKRLMNGYSSLVTVRRDDALHLAALSATTKAGDDALRRRFPVPLDSSSSRILVNAVRSGLPAMRIDTEADADVSPQEREMARTRGYRSALGVPIMRAGEAIGTISVTRTVPGSFSAREIELLQTFAAQAVIAIENVRLFNETKEALERQTATSEILRVISQSPTDVQPVFDAIAAAVLKLCAASSSTVFTFDGELIRIAALVNVSPEGTEAVRRFYPRPPGRDNAASRAVLTCGVITIPDVLEDREIAYRDTAVASGFRSILSVPLIRDGKPIGAISVGRPEPGPFPDKQIVLLQTFADQAVIAIENVRLFTELTHKNRALTQAHAQVSDALERQTATSEVLHVISSSPTDVRPVFETIAASAGRLCSAESAAVYRFDDEIVHFVAGYHFSPEAVEVYRRRFPRPLRETDHLRRILDGSVLNISDIEKDPHTTSGSGDVHRARRSRSTVLVPMLREDRVVGAISVSHRDIGAFTNERVELLKTFATQAVIAIENVRLFNELEARNRDLTESLAHQTATSEILHVISRSPTNLQPVFDIICERAEKLCEAEISVVSRVEGELIHFASIHGVTEEARETVRQFHPMPITVETATGRAIRSRGVAHISDVMADPLYQRKDAATVGGWRCGLAVPMLREGQVIGAIFVGRANPGRFADSKIDLLKTFADQAAIAIQNVRLFDEVQARTRELEESLHQQTATADVLKVISRSAFDLQSVLDTLTESACKLCDAESGSMWRPDGEGFQVAAMFSYTADLRAALMRYVMKPSRDTCVGRTLLEGRTVYIRDAQADPEYQAPDVLAMRGSRAMIGVPLLREGAPIGVLALSRTVARPFTEQQIALATTFADQAVIAIENVRLFNETKEALERQTATSEILRVISQSPRDVRPVFDTIVKSAVRLCEARFGAVFRLDGGLVHLAAHQNLSETLLARWFDYPMPPNRGHVSGRTILAGTAVQVPDILADEEYLGAGVKASGYRSLLGVPLLRGGHAIGAIVIYRTEPGNFADKHIELLKTFADQAVIAIENVRLFTELEARTTQLTRSVGELKALGEVGQAVSSTLDLETVLSTIVSRAVQLAGMDGGSIWEYDEAREQFYVRATDRLPDELIEMHRATPIRKGEGALGRLAMTGEPAEIRDIAHESSYDSRLREILIQCGYRSVLALPLLREDHLLGALAVSRTIPGEFAAEVIALLKTFATQSALAIQNARLYREIEVKSKELEAASRHKSEFLANMSHELRTPLNAIIGFSEVLYQRMFGEINDKQAEYLGDILESGQHLLSLINDILDLSKIEAGRMELEATEFDLPTAIENTLILVRERAQRHGITLGRTIDDRLGSIHGDERKVKQVLLNLLSNALKFTPEGGQIEVRAEKQDGAVEISVRDTGVGIALEDQEAVFEEFRQVGTASKKVEGTGLGLAISRKFIELHGGRIWVKSQVGAGSTFSFTLPLQ